MPIRPTIVLLTAALFFPGYSVAAPTEPVYFDDEEEGWGDEDEEEGWGEEGGDDFGFENTVDVTDIKIDTEAANRAWELSLDGFIRSDTGLWIKRLQTNPFAKARQSLDLKFAYSYEFFSLVLAGHAEYDFAYLYERDSYSNEDLESYEYLVQLRDAYLKFGFDSWELVLGQQIITWGEGDVLSPIDVINTRDQREPGLADLDDIRVPALSTRLSYFFKGARYEFVVVHFPHYGMRPPPFGEFSPLPAALQSGPIRFDLDAIQARKQFFYRDDPIGLSLDNQQYFFRFQYKGAGLDVAVHVASVLYREGVVSIANTSELLDPTIDKVGVDFKHPRYMLGGIALAAPIGPFIFKFEGVVEGQKPLGVIDSSNQNTFLSLAVNPTDIITMMGHITYSGLADQTFTLELQKSIALQLPDNVAIDPGAPVIALRSSHNFLRNDLELNFLFSMFGWTANQGLFGRAEIGYNWFDGFNTSLGYIAYLPSDAKEDLGPLSGYDYHDRLFIKVRFDFSLL